EGLRPPASAVEDDVFGKAMQPERRFDGPKRDLHAGLVRGLRPMMPHELAVADVVRVAMAEVDPPPVRPRDRAAASADSVGLVEDDDAPSLPREQRPGD